MRTYVNILFSFFLFNFQKNKNSMKKLALIICVIIVSLSCGAQQNSTTTKIPNPPAVPEIPKPEPTIDVSGNIIGIATKSSFLEAPFNDWFGFNYKNYELNNETIETLKPLLKNITIKNKTLSMKPSCLSRITRSITLKFKPQPKQRAKFVRGLQDVLNSMH